FRSALAPLIRLTLIIALLPANAAPTLHLATLHPPGPLRRALLAFGQDRPEAPPVRHPQVLASVVDHPQGPTQLPGSLGRRQGPDRVVLGLGPGVARIMQTLGQPQHIEEHNAIDNQDLCRFGPTEHRKQTAVAGTGLRTR